MENAKISMVDISGKKDITRIALAEGYIFLKKDTIKQIKGRSIKKGDVLTTAQLSAINAIKKTPELILLAHNIPISNVDVNFEINEDKNFIKTTVTVKSIGKTGVELEALLGVQIALLSIWDMVKYLEKDKLGQYSTTKMTDIIVIKKKKEEIE